MAKVIARSEIHRGKQIIKPGTVFVSEGAELKMLLDSRAVREVEDGEKIPVPASQVPALDDAPPKSDKPKKPTARRAAKPKAEKPADAGNEDPDNGTDDPNDGQAGEDDGGADDDLV